MKKDFVLEIGMEDLPHLSISSTLKNIRKRLEEELKEERLSYQKVITEGTLRRLIFYIKGLDSRQPDLVHQITGPEKKIAFTPDGKPTPAAIGFAKAKGVKVNELKVKNKDGKEIVFVSKVEKGKSTSLILKEILPKVLSSLSFKESMRWGKLNISFPRPIKYILSLFDKEVIHFSFSGIKSGRRSFGHRSLSHRWISIPSAFSLPDLLTKNFVLINEKIRSSIILSKIKGKGLSLFNCDDLIAEIANRVEYPEVMVGSLPSTIKDLPEIIASSVIKKVKCLPLLNKKKRLSSSFIIVTDGERSDEIREGYERVIESGISDAHFFYEEDLRKGLVSFKKDLRSILFAFDNLYLHSERILSLSQKLGDELNLSKKEKEILKSSASLCKNDIASSLVTEFPELSGIAGGIYAQSCGENKEVANAIGEHCLPRFPGDKIPQTKEGAIVGISDRILNIISHFIKGSDFSSSSDPYGLRRISNGLLEILYQKKWKIPLPFLIEEGIKLFKIKNSKEKKREITDFFSQRLNNLLASYKIPADIRDAILNTDREIIPSIFQRSFALQNWRKDKDSLSYIIAFSRVTNILKQARERKINIPELRENLFSERAEKELYKRYKEIEGEIEKSLKKDDYEKGLEILSSLKKVIDDFFDEVLVMDEDEKLRGNRLALLCEISALFFRFADFSLLQKNV